VVKTGTNAICTMPVSKEVNKEREEKKREEKQEERNI
jgi:hypothetical protein